MNHIIASHTVSISEFRKNPTLCIRQAEGEPIAILSRNTPKAYLISPEAYERMMDLLDDLQLERIVKERLKDRSKAVVVDIDDL